MREHHLGDMRLEDPRDRKRGSSVASITTRSVGAKLCANSSNCSRVAAIRPADRAPDCPASPPAPVAGDDMPF
jgi:hypothetical protein